MSAVTMTPGQATVYRELKALQLPLVGARGDGWVRPFHVRYFRGCDTEPGVLAMSLRQIESKLRALAVRGLVEKREGHNEYRIPRRAAAPQSDAEYDERDGHA